MGKEIERKFIVDPALWNPKGENYSIKQIYLSTEPTCTIRIRITEKNATLTFKGETTGFSRDEFVYKIPGDEAKILYKMGKTTPIVKVRYKNIFKGRTWEIDVFEEANKGLIIAEIELESENEIIEIPEWAIKEVTDDYRYYNSYLAEFPYTKWKNE